MQQQWEVLEQKDLNVPLLNSLSILNAINKLLFPVKHDGSTEETVNVHYLRHIIH